MPGRDNLEARLRREHPELFQYLDDLKLEYDKRLAALESRMNELEARLEYIERDNGEGDW
jgi:BMFP domain-containing protein YqiC